MHRQVSDNCLLAAGVEPSLKLSSAPWDDQSLISRLVEAILNTTRYFHEVAARDGASRAVSVTPSGVA